MSSVQHIWCPWFGLDVDERSTALNKGSKLTFILFHFSMLFLLPNNILLAYLKESKTEGGPRRQGKTVQAKLLEVLKLCIILLLSHVRIFDAVGPTVPLSSCWQMLSWFIRHLKLDIVEVLKLQRLGRGLGFIPDHFRHQCCETLCISWSLYRQQEQGILSPLGQVLSYPWDMPTAGQRSSLDMPIYSEADGWLVKVWTY